MRDYLGTILPGLANTPIQRVPKAGIVGYMRPVAIGRKNWIHIGSEQAGPRVAAILSVVESWSPSHKSSHGIQEMAGSTVTVGLHASRSNFDPDHLGGISTQATMSHRVHTAFVELDAPDRASYQYMCREGDMVPPLAIFQKTIRREYLQECATALLVTLQQSRAAPSLQDDLKKWGGRLYDGLIPQELSDVFRCDADASYLVLYLPREHFNSAADYH